MNDLSTSDIVLAATLSVSGYLLIRIDLKGSKGEFVFANVHDDFVTKFDIHGCRVEPQDFNSAVRHLTTAVKRQLSAR